MPKKNTTQRSITDAMRSKAEAQIKKQATETKYDLRDFTIDYIIQEFREGLFFIPDYQREFIWPEKHKVRFIESIFLGLPIPMMFVADMEENGRLEIVDGTQRIQTLESFKNDDITLKNLKYLTDLDGFKFSDLPLAYQRKFDTKALRMVVLEDSTTVERRQEIFNRINTGSLKAKPSEIRRGNYNSPFMEFIIECTKSPLFLDLCPVSKALADRREREELVLRFFAYSNYYKAFRHDVSKFLDNYFISVEKTFDKKHMKTEFENMLKFVSRHFKFGFAKQSNSKSTPRVRFEAISVGVNFALRIKKDLVPSSMEWLDSRDFKKHTTTHASNSRPKLQGRINYVKKQLLGE